jgi:hypothetical protein
MLDFLVRNWIWIALVGGMLVMHLRGHGGHGSGGCGGGHGHSQGEGQGHGHQDRDGQRPTEASGHAGHEAHRPAGAREPAQGSAQPAPQDWQPGTRWPQL